MATRKKHLYAPKEVMAALGIGRSTFYRLVQRGDFTALHDPDFPRRTFIHADEVEAYALRLLQAANETAAA